MKTKDQYRQDLAECERLLAVAREKAKGLHGDDLELHCYAVIGLQNRMENLQFLIGGKLLADQP